MEGVKGEVVRERVENRKNGDGEGEEVRKKEERYEGDKMEKGKGEDRKKR